MRVKQIDLEKAKRAIESAEKAIDDLVLKAPKDGVVVDRRDPVGGPQVARRRHGPAGDDDHLDPRSDRRHGSPVRSRDVDDGRVSVGMTGTCTLDAYTAMPIPCTVTELTPVARTKGEASLRRSFAVKLSLAKTDPDRMRPGMSVKVELPRPPLKDVLSCRAAPWSSMAGDEDHAGPARGRPLTDVELGPCDAQRCAIAKGDVAAGDTALVGGPP